MNETYRQLNQAKTNSIQLERTKQITDAGQIAIFLLLHIPLAFFMLQVSLLATIHAVFTFAVGLLWAINRKNKHRVAYVGAYIVGAEVLWRMTQARVFWEFSKYALVVIFVIALLEQRGRKHRLLAPLFYFALLLPSLVYTIDAFPLNVARQHISFSISGPMALMAGVWFFANIGLTTYQLQRIFLAITAPALSILTLVLLGALRAEDLYFERGSNFIFSGDFGPNQVSAILSLTVVFLFFYFLDAGESAKLRFFLFIIMGASIFVTALTFSRGGIYMIVGSLALAFFFLLRGASATRQRFILITTLLLLIAAAFLPYLNNFTGGALLERFQDADTSGREFIAHGELQAWLENPLAGTGPGLAESYRLAFYRTPRSHTEFTRMLAEHGLLGLLSLVLLGVMAWGTVRRVAEPQKKAFATAMILWAFMYMAINAMRLAAPSFVFALAAVPWLANASPEDDKGKSLNHKTQFGERRAVFKPRLKERAL